MGRVASALLVGATLIMTMTCSCRAAALYMVGGLAGWDMSTDLNSWVAGKIFLPGDVLAFQFSSYYDLNEVTKEGFDSCNSSNAIFTSKGGNTSIPLGKPGPRFFIPGVRLFCLSGMKLQINTFGNGQQAASPASAPSPFTPPVVQQSPGPLLPPPYQVVPSNNNPTSAAASIVNGVVRELVFLWVLWAAGILSWTRFGFWS